MLLLLVFVFLLLQRVSTTSHMPTTFAFLGPFTVGKNELDGNPAAHIQQLYTSYSTTKIAQTDLLSELTTGGTVSWVEIKTQNNKIPIHLRDVDFNTLVQSLFSMEVQEVQGWVVGEITVTVSGTYSVRCMGMLTCYLDDLTRMLTGDIFQTGRVVTPVHLSQGKHLVYGYVKFVARTQVEVHINGPMVPKKKKMLFHPPAFSPDLIGIGSLKDPDVATTPYYMSASTFVSVPVTNLDVLSYRVKYKVKQSAAANHQYGLTVVAPPSLPVVFPGQFTSVPVQFAMEKGLLSTECPLTFQLIPLVQKLNQSKTRSTTHNRHRWIQQDAITVQCRCRSTRQSFIFTFVDHDGSIARAAAIGPLLAAAKRKHTKSSAAETTATAGVLLSLHGTGVDVSMQADSYKYKPTKHANDDKTPYTFGVESMWTLAPTRDGAHNWEYSGFLSALKALQTLGTPNKDGNGSIVIPAQISSQMPAASIHFRDVIFTGHSMGGHGAWQIATHVPDRGLGVMSAAGWIRKEYYGDSNRFFVHDIGRGHIDASLKGLLESTFQEYNADLHASNLKGLVVHARIGANDRSVPPFQVRKMVRVLREHGVATSYEEMKGKEHWWWDTKTPNDGGVLNDRKLRKVYKKMAHDRVHQNSCATNRFTLVTMHPGAIESKCGVRILQIVQPLRMSKLKVRSTRSSSSTFTTWHIETQNVRRLSVNGNRLCSSWPCNFIIDGAGHRRNSSQPIRLTKTMGIIEYCSARRRDSTTMHMQEVDSRGQWQEQEQNQVQAQQLWQQCATSDPVQLSLVSRSSYSFEQFERGPTNSGPARQLFASPFIIVTSFHTLPSSLSLYTANIHMVAAATSVQIVLDTFLSNKEEQRHNLFVVGRYNRLLQQQQLARRENKNIPNPPVDILPRGGFRVGPCVFNESGLGILFTAPFWDPVDRKSRLRVYMLGTDDEGLRAVASLLQPTIPPMYRAPLSNQMPDFMVVSTRILTEGAGGILAAGMWAYDWSWSAPSSYWRC